ncbi:MAG TPA: hypothetical protein VGE52_05935 [Pirellulales bacterium]
MSAKWSVRSMLLLVVVAAMLFALVNNYFLAQTPEGRLFSAGAFHHRVTIDEAAAIELLQLEKKPLDANLMANVYRLDYPIDDLSLRGAMLSPEVFQRLGELKTLRYLDVSSTNVTDAHLAAIAKATSLQALNLRETKITDAGLASLLALPNLTHLDLAGTAISDQGALTLARIPTLISLDVSNTNVGDAGAAALLALPSLERINLGGTRITDAAFASLAPNAKLLDVAIDDTEAGDRAVAKLAALPNLRELRVQQTRATAASVGPLAKRDSLRWLCYEGSMLDSEAQREVWERPDLTTYNFAQMSAIQRKNQLDWTLDGHRRTPPEMVDTQSRGENYHGHGAHTMSGGVHRRASDVRGKLFELLELAGERQYGD